MKNRFAKSPCVDCGADISHRGCAAKRCEACFKERKNDRRRERRKNPEFRAKEYAVKNAQRRERRKSDPEYRERENARDRERNKRRSKEYIEKKNARQRERVRRKYQTDPAFRESERKRKSNPKYLKRHRERVRERYHSDDEWREAKLLAWRLRQPWDKTVNEESVNGLLEKQDGMCPYCGDDIRGSFHMDHIMPLSRGGVSTLSNLQLTCGSCNHRKSDKHPDTFAREMRSAAT